MFAPMVVQSASRGVPDDHLGRDDDTGAWGPPLEDLIRRDPLRGLDEPGWTETVQAAPSGYGGLELDIATENPAALDDSELIDAITGFERVTAWAGARQARLVAEFARRRPGTNPDAGLSDRAQTTSRWAPDEIGCALTLSRLTAAERLSRSTRLDTVLTATRHAWETGQLDVSKVRAITDTCHVLDDDTAVAVQNRVLSRATSQTVAQLRAALKRAVIAADPEGAAARHRAARRDRRVVCIPAEDGMATLWACLTAPDALTAYGWLTALARGLGSHDPRSMDEKRADLMVALLTGRLTITPPTDGDGETTSDPGTRSEPGTRSDAGADGAMVAAPATTTDASAAAGAAESVDPTAQSAAEAAAPTPGSATQSAAQSVPPSLPRPVHPGKPLVQILIPHDTLTGTADHPVDLVGYGPIPAEMARDIATDAVWTRLITDPLSGTLLDHGRTTYRPPPGLADFVRARDQHCRFPTCRRRALDAELDHTTAWNDGGPTTERNLYTACLLHHHLKHDAGWTVTQHPDARITWTTPTGHTYTSEPHDHRPEPTPAPAPAPGTRPPPPRRRDVLGPDLRLIHPVLPDVTDDAPF